LYTPCILRGAFIFYKISYLSKIVASNTSICRHKMKRKKEQNLQLVIGKD
jgi:hypothetical protein